MHSKGDFRQSSLLSLVRFEVTSRVLHVGLYSVPFQQIPRVLTAAFCKFKPLQKEMEVEIV